jgi:DNA-binding transcriptional MerR regulator
MDDCYTIGEVAAATGVTLRTLRFYEARGLLAPLRTAAGRRVYGPGELARLNAALALRRAGFSVARIRDLLADREVDLARAVAAQLAHLELQAAALAESRALLLSVQSRIDRGEPIDVATICSLIRNKGTTMNDTDWNRVVDDHFSPEEQERFRATMPTDFDAQDYTAGWRELGARIEAALPLDPACPRAQAFVDEWSALLKPFTDVATPKMQAGVARMYDNRPNWNAQPDMGFGPDVWTFIRAASDARR